MSEYNKAVYEKNKSIIDETIAKYVSRKKDVDDRASKLILPDAYSVVIEKIDQKEISTFLLTDDRAKKDVLRQSTICRIVRVSNIESSNPEIEGKKRNLKVGDHCFINPETPWHLGIEGFFELWVCHVDNIILCDSAYDPVEVYRQTLLRRYPIA